MCVPKIKKKVFKCWDVWGNYTIYVTELKSFDLNDHIGVTKC